MAAMKNEQRGFVPSEPSYFCAKANKSTKNCFFCGVIEAPAAIISNIALLTEKTRWSKTPVLSLFFLFFLFPSSCLMKVERQLCAVSFGEKYAQPGWSVFLE